MSAPESAAEKRITTILDHDAAALHPKMAGHLAYETDMDAGEAIRLMQAAAPAGQPTPTNSHNLSADLPARRRGLTLIEAIKLGFRGFFTFSGRSTRAEFWWWTLFIAILSIIPIVNIAAIFLAIPTFALAARRLHDVNSSGWWQLLPWAAAAFPAFETRFLENESTASYFPVLSLIELMSIAVQIIFVTIWYGSPSTPGPNRFGPNPFEVTP